MSAGSRRIVSVSRELVISSPSSSLRPALRDPTALADRYANRTKSYLYRTRTQSTWVTSICASHAVPYRTPRVQTVITDVTFGTKRTGDPSEEEHHDHSGEDG